MSYRRTLDDPAFPLLALAVACVVAFVAYLCLTHPCASGHYETRHVPGHLEHVSGYQVSLGEKSSDRLTFTPVWIPDHDESVWVCEEPSPDRILCRGKATVQLGQTAPR